MTDSNDQGAFAAGTNLFTAPATGTYLFGATLLYKVNASTTARMRARLVLNGTTKIRGSMGEISGEHVSLATALWLQTMVPLTAGDTVELQGYFRVADGYFVCGGYVPLISHLQADGRAVCGGISVARQGLRDELSLWHWPAGRRPKA
ncbi:MAG: hypothetical protein Q8Q26_10945, partial [Pseudorhodobacter sp.]|nr:hypothetical protein [Pseudorhodobacter sp.]